jgi:catechol 2,3-dioxygenase-like lactoylglutathione lyase family enzyme
VKRGVHGLAEIVLWVRDMDIALHFYEELFGLEVISPPELPIKFLKAADGELGIPQMIVLVVHPEGLAFPRAKGERVLHHIAFRVAASEYDSLRRRLEADGNEIRSGVHPVLKGVRTFYVDDPDGNEVEIISPDPGAARQG